MYKNSSFVASKDSINTIIKYFSRSSNKCISLNIFLSEFISFIIMLIILSIKTNEASL